MAVSRLPSLVEPRSRRYQWDRRHFQYTTSRTRWAGQRCVQRLAGDDGFHLPEGRFEAPSISDDGRLVTFSDAPVWLRAAADQHQLSRPAHLSSDRLTFAPTVILADNLTGPRRGRTQQISGNGQVIVLSYHKLPLAQRSRTAAVRPVVETSVTISRSTDGTPANGSSSSAVIRQLRTDS